MGNVNSTKRHHDNTCLEPRRLVLPFRFLDVRHVPPGTSRSDVETFFGLYGDVAFVDMYRRDSALVKYKNPIDARRVEEMSHMNQGLEIFGKRIVVERRSDYEFIDGKDLYSKTEPSSHINNLPNECLNNIFSFLPVEDLVKTREVCERWASLSDNIMGKVKSIKHVSTKINIQTTYKLITAHWERLESLEITFCNFNVPEIFFESIRHNFKNLKHISLIWKDSLGEKRRRRFWPKFNNYHISDRQLRTVLVLPELETVSLSNLNKTNGKVLSCLSETVHTIKFNGCRALKGKYVARALTSVSKIIFENKTYLSDLEIIQILFDGKSLNYISLNGHFPKVRGCIYYQIAEMRFQMKHIDLSYNYSIRLHHFMLIIYTCLQLETINVSGTLCISGTNSRMFLLHLQYYDNLETLCINDLPIDNKTLAALSFKESLLTLEIKGNELLSYNGFCHIIQSFPNLRTLDIRACRGVRANSLEVLSTVPRSTRLTILAQGSGIEKNHEFYIPENVNLVL